MDEKQVIYWNRIRRVMMALQRIQDDLQMIEGQSPGDNTWYHVFKAKVHCESAMLNILNESRPEIDPGDN